VRCIISHPHRLSLHVLRSGLLGSYKFALKRGDERSQRNYTKALFDTIIKALSLQRRISTEDFLMGFSCLTPFQGYERKVAV